MKWKSARTYQAAQFKRLVGVERETFDKMVLEINKSKRPSNHKVPGKKRGSKPKLRVEDELLMMLMYYREYRTFFHTGAEFDVSETQCWRIVTRIEKILIDSQLFHLPGKKKLLESDHEWEGIIVDAAEHAVERPKKSSGGITQEKRRSILLKAR
jgi:hypothetical protein